MKFSNIIEKLEIIFNLIIDSKFLTILTFLIIGTILLRLFNITNNKKTNILIFLIEFLMLILILYNNNTYFLNTLNNIINDLFKNFYFPSIYVYLFTTVCTIILFICININKYISNTYKTITKIYFFLFNFINILLIKELVTNKIDVLKKQSLFTNNNVLILLEIAIYLFFLYLVINVLFYVANNVITLIINKRELKIQLKDTSQEVVSNEISIYTANETPFINLPLNSRDNISFNDLIKETSQVKITSQEEQSKKTKKINLVPEINLNNTRNYQFIDRTLLENESEISISFNNTKTSDENNDLINNTIPNKKQVIEKNTNIIKESTFTLNDYKLFSKMLRTVIENNNNRNDLTIKDILDKKILYKYTYEEYKRFEKILNSCMN